MSDQPAQDKVIQPIKSVQSAPPPTQTTETSSSGPLAPVGVNSEGKEVALPEVEKTEKLGPDVDTLIPKDPYYIDPLFYEVANYFGIEQEEHGAAKNYLSEIVDYVIREIKSNDPGEVLLKLREIESTIAPPTLGERRFKKVYQYVRLAGKKQGIEQAMKALENPLNGYEGA